jgi:hypothetical protein
MSTAVHVKHYPDPNRRIAAQGHLRWLHGLGADVRLPVEHAGTCARLVLEHLPGRHAALADLITVTDALGRLHGTAYVKELHASRLARDHHTRNGMRLPHSGQAANTYSGTTASTRTGPSPSTRTPTCATSSSPNQGRLWSTSTT